MISELENNSIIIKIKSKGAELSSIYSKKTALEYLWNADEKFWPRHAPVLFPIVGKLKNNSYTIDNKSYTMSQHGFARDKDFIIKEKSTNHILFELNDSEDTLKIYPFKFKLQIEYKITNESISVIYRVLNTDHKTIYFSIGGHPGFKLPLFDTESFNDYFIEFEEKENAKIEILDGAHISGAQKEFLNNESKILISNELFKNDALIFSNLKSKSVQIRSKKTEHGIQFDFDGFPYIAFWSKPGPFVCIEPWYGIADYSEHNGDFKSKTGVQTLEIGKTFESKYVISLF